MIGPFYRVGNDLVTADGTVMIHPHIETGRDAHLSYVCLRLPDQREAMVRQRDYPHEYAQYLALYEAAPLLSTVLREEQQQGEQQHE